MKKLSVERLDKPLVDRQAESESAIDSMIKDFGARHGRWGWNQHMEVETVNFDRFAYGPPDPQDRPYQPERQRIHRTAAEIERLKKLDLWEEEEDE